MSREKRHESAKRGVSREKAARAGTNGRRESGKGRRELGKNICVSREKAGWFLTYFCNDLAFPLSCLSTYGKGLVATYAVPGFPSVMSFYLSPGNAGETGSKNAKDGHGASQNQRRGGYCETLTVRLY